MQVRRAFSFFIERRTATEILITHFIFLARDSASLTEWKNLLEKRDAIPRRIIEKIAEETKHAKKRKKGKTKKSIRKKQLFPLKTRNYSLSGAMERFFILKCVFILPQKRILFLSYGRKTGEGINGRNFS